MTKLATPEELGEPNLRVAGFQLWVHGYQFAKSTDYWDANWLRVTAHCGAAGASVWSSGAILMNVDLARWADQCDELHAGRSTKAALVAMEPELEASINPLGELGRFTLRVEITPVHLTQGHWFEFEVDPSDLPRVARMCREIVRLYPVRGER